MTRGIQGIAIGHRLVPEQAADGTKIRVDGHEHDLWVCVVQLSTFLVLDASQNRIFINLVQQTRPQSASHPIPNGKTFSGRRRVQVRMSCSTFYPATEIALVFESGVRLMGKHAVVPHRTAIQLPRGHARVRRVREERKAQEDQDPGVGLCGC